MGDVSNRVQYSVYELGDGGLELTKLIFTISEPAK